MRCCLNDYETGSSFNYYTDGAFDMEEAIDMDISYIGNGSTSSSSDKVLATEQSNSNSYGDRKIIRNAGLMLETKQYDDALTAIDRLVTAYSGYVESSQSYGTSLESNGGARSLGKLHAANPRRII